MYRGYAGAKVHNFEIGEEVPLGLFPQTGPADVSDAVLGNASPTRGCPSIELPPVLGLKTDFFQVIISSPRNSFSSRLWTARKCCAFAKSGSLMGLIKVK